MIAQRVRVTGRVQGVFFRAWTAEQARALRIGGWVRNCADGSVEAHVEGEKAAVARMLSLFEDGPAGARVDHVEVRRADLQGDEAFDIRH